MIDLFYEVGPNSFLTSTFIAKKLKERGQWTGKSAKTPERTPERTVHSYLTEDPDKFNSDGAGSYYMTYRRK